jgi:multidrug efflux system outer membrane protein
MRRLQSFVTSLLLLGVVGCAVGPKYQQAAVPTAPSWSTEGPWRAATPRDAIPRGNWWSIYADDQLNAYEQQATTENQSLQIALQRLEQARQVAVNSEAGLFPSLTGGATAQRQRLSANRPVPVRVPTTTAFTQNTFSVPFVLNYELDLFGRVRRNIESSKASYQASAADLENVRLLVTSEIAADYFSLRELDSEIQVVQQAIDYQRKGLKLVENRHAEGIVSGLDVAQQQAVVEATEAQLALLQRERFQFEHSLAVLVGVPASAFHVPAGVLSQTIPAVPLGVPSDVLERRPDVAEAERQVASSNALIGVAKTGYYPSILLGGGGGWQSSDIAKLADLPSTFWSLGASVVQSIASGGRVHSQVRFAEAGNQASVAAYRQTVLVAFQQVEDGLTGLNTLNDAAITQQRAVASSQRALDIANNRYVGGLVSYLDVVTAQETLLNNQRLATQIQGQQLLASVVLVKGLGGGWDRRDIDQLDVKPTLKQAVTP